MGMGMANGSVRFSIRIIAVIVTLTGLRELLIPIPLKHAVGRNRSFIAFIGLKNAALLWEMRLLLTLVT